MYFSFEDWNCFNEALKYVAVAACSHLGKGSNPAVTHRSCFLGTSYDSGHILGSGRLPHLPSATRAEDLHGF